MAPEPAHVPERRGRGVRQRLGRLAPAVRWESALVVALVAVYFLGTSISSQFTSSYNLFTLGTNIGDLAILALPMTLIIITGEIDLSVASTLALSAEVLGALWIAPLGDAADLPCVPRDRSRLRRDQRILDHPRRPAIARGHDRNAHPVPRARQRRARTYHGVELSVQVHERRRQRPVRDLVAVVLGRDLRGARDRVRRRAAVHADRSLPVRDRAQPGRGVSRRHQGQADQDEAVRAVGSGGGGGRPAVRVRACLSRARTSGSGSSCRW